MAVHSINSSFLVTTQRVVCWPTFRNTWSVLTTLKRCFETSANGHYTPYDNPETRMNHSDHGESLKSLLALHLLCTTESDDAWRGAEQGKQSCTRDFSKFHNKTTNFIIFSFCRIWRRVFSAQFWTFRVNCSRLKCRELLDKRQSMMTFYTIVMFNNAMRTWHRTTYITVHLHYNTC
jgi:hypothetical protein